VDREFAFPAEGRSGSLLRFGVDGRFGELCEGFIRFLFLIESLLEEFDSLWHI
jgi:hypothetical protein